MSGNIIRIAVIFAGIGVASAWNACAAEYILMPSPQTVHIGFFSAAQKPVLTINSGDIVTIETESAELDPAEIDRSGAVPPSVVPEYVRSIYREVTDRGAGRAVLTGPIFINGAMPGDVLEARILDIDLAVSYGFNSQRPYSRDTFCGSFRSISGQKRPRSHPVSSCR